MGLTVTVANIQNVYIARSTNSHPVDMAPAARMRPSALQRSNATFMKFTASVPSASSRGMLGDLASTST